MKSSFPSMFLATSTSTAMWWLSYSPSPSSSSSLVGAVPCLPCIRRDALKIRGVFHGQSNDAFWQQVQAVAQQTASDLGIVDLEITLYDDFDPDVMARDIQAIAALPASERPDALIVTIPSDVVEAPVANAVQAGIPVFGFNSGYESLEPTKKALAWVAQDEYLAGVAAAQTFAAHFETLHRPLRRALFLNHEKGNRGIEERMRGYQDGLRTAAATAANAANAANTANATNATNATAATAAGPDEASMLDVQEIVIDGQLDDTVLVEILRPQFVGCQWDIVLLASARVMELTLEAFDGLFADCTGRTYLGSFDANVQVLEAIRQGKALFGVSQQHHLQGFLPVVLATLYATTGQLPAAATSSDNNGGSIFLSGPTILDQSNVPTQDFQLCGDQAFPVCTPMEWQKRGQANPLTMLQGPQSLRSNNCACTDRLQIRLGVALSEQDDDKNNNKNNNNSHDHDHDLVYRSSVTSAAFAAANDLGIQLEALTLPSSINSGGPSSNPNSIGMDVDHDDDDDDGNSAMMTGVTPPNMMTGRTPVSLWEACHEDDPSNYLDGILVGIPFLRSSSPLAAAIQGCLDKNIPIIAVGGELLQVDNDDDGSANNNDQVTVTTTTSTDGTITTSSSSSTSSGVGDGNTASFSQQQPQPQQRNGVMHHIRPDRHAAGVLAGQAFADMDNRVEQVWCFYDNTLATLEMCRGLKEAILSVGIKFEDNLTVLEGDGADFLQVTIDLAVPTTTASGTRNWQGVGVFLTDPTMLPLAQALVTEHPEMAVGVMGATDVIYAQMDDGVVTFALDAHWHMQGYLPIALLTYSAYTQQRLTNEVISILPKLLMESPTMGDRACQANMFPTCPKSAWFDTNQNARSAAGRLGYGFDTFLFSSWFVVTVLGLGNMIATTSMWM